MYIWINGPFGIGKSTTALALRRLARSEGSRARIYDPERFGSLLQRTVPQRFRPRDFRSQRSWNRVTQAAVRLGALGRGWLIVPMTLSDPAQLQSLTWRASGRVFQLVAPRATIEARIRSRPFGVAWSLEHLARWPDLDALGERVQTGHRTPDEVAAAIVRALSGDPRADSICQEPLPGGGP